MKYLIVLASKLLLVCIQVRGKVLKKIKKNKWYLGNNGCISKFT